MTSLLPARDWRRKGEHRLEMFRTLPKASGRHPQLQSAVSRDQPEPYLPPSKRQYVAEQPPVPSQLNQNTVSIPNLPMVQPQIYAGPASRRVQANSDHTPPQRSEEKIRGWCKAHSISELESLIAMTSDLFASTPPFSYIHDELSQRYRKTICRLLTIDVAHISSTSLDHMRIYGRAYNGSMQTIPWSSPLLPARYQHGDGPFVTDTAGMLAHFAVVMQSPMIVIAKARGDIYLIGDKINEFGKGPFYLELSEEQERALGLIPNPFGMPVGLGRQPGKNASAKESGR
jgi:hypothetical protein